MESRFGTQTEMDVWEKFKATYTKRFPTPEKASVRLMDAIGWQFISVIVHAIGALALASMRTADMFYLAAAGSNEFLRYGEAIAAIVTVEFGAVVFASLKADREGDNMDEAAQKNAARTAITQLVVADVICLIISIVAGLGVSFRGFGIEVVYFKWILSLSLGAGASIVAVVSGTVLGTMLVKFTNMRANMSGLYKKDLAAWDTDLNLSWENSPEREISRNSTNAELVRARDNITALRGDLRENRRIVRPNTRSVTERTSERTPNDRTYEISPVTQKIFDFLDEYMSVNPSSPVPGPSRLVRELGVSKSHASTQIATWRSAHPEFPTSEIDVTDVGINITQEIDALIQQ